MRRRCSELTNCFTVLTLHRPQSSLPLKMYPYVVFEVSSTVCFTFGYARYYISLIFESTSGGTQSYKSGRQTSRLSSEFWTVQVQLGLGNLSALRTMHFRGFDCTQTSVNVFGTKRSVVNAWLLFRGVCRFHCSSRQVAQTTSKRQATSQQQIA